jgi:hypothetical protein
MGKARRGRREEGPFTGRYEGPEVLSALLAQAGSPHEAEEVAEHFREAQAAGEPRSDVIPALFPEEPRFATPEDARRLYENLFGLWDRISAGLGAADDAPEAVPSPAARPPDRGSLDGRELTPGFVEQAWRWLAALPVRDEARLRDRFGGAQPDLLAWLDQVELPDTGETAAHDLVFETWAMLDQGVDDRLGAVDWSELRELEAEPPPLESVQPALAVYVAEQLDNLADEKPAFGEAERAQVERVIAAAAAALTRVVAED